MAELLSPGVYIQERDLGPQPIEGVSTTTAGFVGEAQRGLTSGPPTLVTSFEDFQRKFGSFVSGMTLAYAIRGFFDNGGRRAYVSRVTNTTSTTASGEFSGAGFNVRILAASGSQVTLSSVVGLEIDHSGPPRLATLDLVPRDGSTATSVVVDSVNSTTGVVTLANPIPSGLTPATYFARIPGVSSTVTFGARDPGGYGERIAVLVDARYGNSAQILANLSTTSWTVSSTSGLSVGDHIQFETKSTATDQYRRVVRMTGINPGTGTIETEEAQSEDFVGGRIYRVFWRVTVQFDGAVVEVLDDLPTSTPEALLNAVNARSEWVRVLTSTTPPPDPPDLNPGSEPSIGRHFPHFVLGQAELLSGGEDDAPTAAQVIGTVTPERSGLKALEGQDGINVIAAPGYVAPDVVGELIGQSERLMDRFAVFESGIQGSGVPQASGPESDINEVLIQRGGYNSRYAAMYHPWIRVSDPAGTGTLLLPPTGHVLGCYARTDIERGVYKAPANIVLRGVTGFSSDVTTGEQDVLNPAGVNVLRNLDGLGNVIWGARTISAEGLWKYVSVRRLFVFLEQSIVKGTRFAVFEPNDPRLWARLRDALVNFLTSQWRSGALFGAKPEEAFFVRVDETTTTQDDRDNGRVNIIVGIAPVKPAEFIVFQIGQAPSSVIIAEQT